MSNSSYGHRVTPHRYNSYKIEWTFDVNPEGSCTRYSRTMSKDVDEASAIKFAKKHGAPNFVIIPEEMKDLGYSECIEYVRAVRGW